MHEVTQDFLYAFPCNAFKCVKLGHFRTKISLLSNSIVYRYEPIFSLLERGMSVYHIVYLLINIYKGTKPTVFPMSRPYTVVYKVKAV